MCITHLLFWTICSLSLRYQGSDYDTAVQILTATNYDLQQAVNLHLERINEPNESNDVSPEDEVAGKLIGRFYCIYIDHSVADSK